MNNALINISHVKKYAIHAAGELRPYVGFKRVSQEFLDRIEGRLRRMVEQEVKAQPSRGITIR